MASSALRRTVVSAPVGAVARFGDKFSRNVATSAVLSQRIERDMDSSNRGPPPDGDRAKRALLKALEDDQKETLGFIGHDEEWMDSNKSLEDGARGSASTSSANRSDVAKEAYENSRTNLRGGYGGRNLD